MRDSREGGNPNFLDQTFAGKMMKMQLIECRYDFETVNNRPFDVKS
jgi:hypothetical protein